MCNMTKGNVCFINVILLTLSHGIVDDIQEFDTVQ